MLAFSASPLAVTFALTDESRHRLYLTAISITMTPLNASRNRWERDNDQDNPATGTLQASDSDDATLGWYARRGGSRTEVAELKE